MTGVVLNTIDVACAIERDRVHNGPPEFKGLCQKQTRTAINAPTWADSALHAAEIVAAHHQMHKVTSFAAIPWGAMIYFDFDPFGHVMLAGKRHAFSNDYFRSGHIDVVPRDIPHWNGAKHIIGYSLWTPFGVMTH